MKDVEELFLYFLSSMFLVIPWFSFALKLHSSEYSQPINNSYKSEKYQKKILKLIKLLIVKKKNYSTLV